MGESVGGWIRLNLSRNLGIIRLELQKVKCQVVVSKDTHLTTRCWWPCRAASLGSILKESTGLGSLRVPGRSRGDGGGGPAQFKKSINPE